MQLGRIKIRYSVSLAYSVIYIAFLAVSIGLLSVYPTISSRDSVFSAKQNALTSQVTVMSVSLAALEQLSAEGVEQVMNLLDVGEYDRVLVTDSAGLVLYDTETRGSLLGQSCAFPQVLDALVWGNISCRFRYDTLAFSSEAAAPVMSYGSVIGSVYLHERDTDQADMIRSLQGRLRSISLIAGAVTLLLTVLFSRYLTRRLRTLVDGMRIVREGDYDYRVPVKGADEVSDLSEAFNEMTGRLQSTDELRRRFVSDASHELRTPLASIRLLSDSVVQSDRMDPDTMREFVTDIGTEAERLQRLTEKLMRLTRMDSKLPVSRSPVQLKAVAERAVHLLRPLAEQKNVTVRAELDESAVIYAAEDDLLQIVFNLTENAIKYNSRGGSVTLRLTREGDRAVLRVEDTGIGIPAEDLPHVFERFYRVDKARSREAGGSGLGLSIVHDAVLRHNGTIRAERRDPAGSRFTVSFPLYAGETGGGEE